MAIFKGRVRVRYGYSRWGYTRNNGKGWHGGSDEEGLDSTTIRMPDYKGKSISGRVVTARKVDRSTGSKTWEWGWYVCVELDAGQTPDAVNYLYFCHNARNLVSVGQRVESGDALAVMGSTGNASLASPPFAHCHFEVRATAAGAGLDPTAYTGHPNAVGTYGEAIDETEDSDMKFLEVTSGKCEVFTAPDVNAVDKHYNGGIDLRRCRATTASFRRPSSKKWHTRCNWSRPLPTAAPKSCKTSMIRCRIWTMPMHSRFLPCSRRRPRRRRNAGSRCKRRPGRRVRKAAGGKNEPSLPPVSRRSRRDLRRPALKHKRRQSSGPFQSGKCRRRCADGSSAFFTQKQKCAPIPDAKRPGHLSGAAVFLFKGRRAGSGASKDKVWPRPRC